MNVDGSGGMMRTIGRRTTEEYLRYSAAEDNAPSDSSNQRATAGIKHQSHRILCFAFAWLFAGRVESQAVVTVLAESRLELRAETAEDTTTLFGRLTDELGVPLEQARVTLQTGSDRVEVRTDSVGNFQHTVQRADSFLVLATYDGGPLHRPIVVRREIRAGEQSVVLRMSGPRELDLGVRDHEFEIAAASGVFAATVTVSIYNEEGSLLATQHVAGRARVRLQSSQLGARGPGRIVAESASTERFAAARVELPVLRFVMATMELSLDQSGRIVAGRLAVAGEPLAARVVGVFAAGDTHLASTFTDSAGRFAFRPRPNWPAEVRVRFVSDQAGLRSVSQSIALPPAPSSEGTSYLSCLAPMVFVLAVLLVLAVRRYRERGLLVPELASPAVEFGRKSAAGQVLLSGVVRGRDGEKLAAVSLTVAGRSLISGQGGEQVSFAFQLEAGDALLVVEAEEHMPIEMAVRIPHSGELQGMVIRLVTTRRALLSMWRERTGISRTDRRTLRDYASRESTPLPLRNWTARIEELVYGAATLTPLQVTEMHASTPESLH